MATTSSGPNLATYRQKRDFARTKEPRGERKPHRKAASPAKEELSFVVQKHAARRLHYDFRLELEGVLLSWAVPKGPSLNPGDKRLAVETEPHPLEYGKFEGTIAEGQYGAGEVEIWDRGTWQPEGDAKRDYERGRLSFRLDGTKLHGAWHLVRTGNGAKGGKAWLLFKSKDEFARDDKARLADVEPELATLVTAAPEGDAWLHELKLDGYRLLVRAQGGSVRLLTRNGKDWTDRFPVLARAFGKLGLDAALIDGEVVALDEHGVSQFQTLQNSLTLGRDAELVYYAFDLLHLDGRDQRELPLVERKQKLERLLKAAPKSLAPMLRFSAHVLGGGPEFFQKACELGAEGIISKRADAPYRSGRGRDWLKVKCTQESEFVIVGYTDPGGSRSHFGALLLAVAADSGLTYVGRVGTGFSEASLKELHRRLAPLGVKKTELANAPGGAEARAVHWVKPELVAQIGFATRTEDGLLRHPTFLGLRDDKPAAEVRDERPVAAPVDASPATPRATSYPLTHPDKVLYPEDGITKRELLEYYELVAERMLPHVRNRPLTLVRCPNGWDKACFFQKHPGEGLPPGIRAVAIREAEGKAPYGVIDDAEGLFGLVQQGALEIHTWGSRADDPERPDLLVFDLDPDPSVDFSAVIACARELRRTFESAHLESFVKTAGGKGLHVCVPIRPELTWDPIKDFCRRIAEELASRYPERYVATASKSKRRGKVFIDYLRNARGATFVAPYSTRAREHAPIAVPLAWDELDENFRPDRFTLRTLRERLAQGGPDPFERLTSLAPSLASDLAR